MENMESIMARAENDAADLGKHLGAVGVLDNISDLITDVLEKADQSELVMDVIQKLALIVALGNVARDKVVAAGVTQSSNDDLVHVKYTPTSYSYKLSPEELKEVFKNAPRAIKISKSLLKEAAPEQYVKYSDDAHKVEVKKPYASLTDSRGLIKMFDVFLQLAVRDLELKALYGQS